MAKPWQLSAEGLALIARFEGFRPGIYRDVAGWETIGYGHRLQKDEAARYVQGVTEEEARALLKQDARRAESAVQWLIRRDLTQHQYDALVSFTYNLGAAALQRSTLRRLVNRGEDAGVPHAFGLYVWAGGKKWPGLVARRAAEARFYAEVS